MNGGGLLIHGEFVAYFPALGRALGSVEDAVLVQALWFRRERSTGATVATIAELAESVGMAERTARRRLSKLADAGVVSKGRAGAYDATTVWTVHLDRIPAKPEAARMATSGVQNGGVDAANLAGSHEANLAGSQEANLAGSSLYEELKNKDKNVVGPADAVPAPSEQERPEVEALCEKLAKWVEVNGGKRPNITKGWRDAARLLLDVDGRTVEDVAAAIDWSQRDEFWRSNILSMRKLRQKFDTLRLQAQSRAAGPRDRQGEVLRAEMDRARAMDAAASQGGPRVLQGVVR